MSEQLVRTGIAFPRETLKKIDERRGQYYSRNRYMLKIIEEHLELEDSESKSVQGPKVTTPPAQAPPSTLPPSAPTTTNEINTEPPTTTTINKIEQCLTHMSTDDEVASAVSGATGV